MTIENIIMLLVVWLANAITMFLLFKDPEISKPDEEGNLAVSKRFLWIYSVVFMLINTAIVVLFINVYTENTILFSLKRFCILALLWPIGLIDFKTYRIPNKFIVTGLVFRAVLLIAELFLERKYLLGEIIAEFVAAVALFLAAFVCSICMKNSIGFGDIKLFIVMGLLLGTNGIWTAVFMSLIVAFFVAIFLLVAKKKGKKDIVPFAPSIMIGTYISIILTGM